MCDLIWSDGPMNTKSDSCWTRWPMRPVWNRGLSDSVPHFFLTEVYLTHNCVRLRCTPVDFVLLSLLLTSDFFPLSLKFPWSFCTLFLSCPTEVTTGAAFSLQLSFRIFSKKGCWFPFTLLMRDMIGSWETATASEGGKLGWRRKSHHICFSRHVVAECRHVPRTSTWSLEIFGWQEIWVCNGSCH